MNTRASGSPPSRRLAPAILLVVGVLVGPGASARAECGSHADRPTIPLESTRVAAQVERPGPPDRTPTCSGLSCPRKAFPPIASTSKPFPRVDLCDGTKPEPAPGLQASSRAERPEEFHPIGRETEVERPPCGSASAE